MQTKETNLLIQRYQSLYEQNPESKIFAPLAEAYRREGLLERAIQVAEHGVRLHPHFASGRVALGKCYFEKKDFQKAAVHLSAAADLSPENILAHQLLAECELALGNNKKALSALKMVLFLNPKDKAAARAVKDLEDGIMKAEFGEMGVGPTPAGSEENTSDEMDEYSMRPLSSVRQTLGNTPTQITQSISPQPIERQLALFDAWFDRGDWNRAEQILKELPAPFQSHPEVRARRQKLEDLTRTGFSTIEDVEWISPLDKKENSKKIQQLENLLSRIDSRKRT